MNNVRILLLTLCMAGAAPCGAQDFAVASVKSNQIGNSGKEGSEFEKITLSPTGVTMFNVSLRSCIRWAYNARDYQILGPGWLSSQRYDIAANAPGPADVAELRAMMQRLLADRFKLSLRHELKELPVYAMVIGKKGARLRPASGGESSSMRPEGGALAFKNYPMPEFAERFRARPLKLDRLVIDKTGLTGVYDFKLEFADNLVNLKHTLEGMDRGGTDQSVFLFTILEEQLGLSLKAQKAQVESLIIDHAERVPTEN